MDCLRVPSGMDTQVKHRYYSSRRQLLMQWCRMDTQVKHRYYSSTSLILSALAADGDQILQCSKCAALLRFMNTKNNHTKGDTDVQTIFDFI